MTRFLPVLAILFVMIFAFRSGNNEETFVARNFSFADAQMTRMLKEAVLSDNAPVSLRLG